MKKDPPHGGSVILARSQRVAPAFMHVKQRIGRRHTEVSHYFVITPLNQSTVMNGLFQVLESGAEGLGQGVDRISLLLAEGLLQLACKE